MSRHSAIVQLVVPIAALAASILLVLGFFGRLHPALDSLAHFRVHLAAALIVAAIPLVAMRGFRWQGFLAAALGAWAILNLTGMPFLSGPARVQASDQPGPIYRLMHLNLRYDNPEPGKVLSLIGRVRPDVLTLNEVSKMWAERLALLSGAYPYRIVCDIGNHAGGVAILSLRPFAAGTEGKCLEGGTFATAAIDFGGPVVEVGALHLRWPWPLDQAAHIDNLAPLLGRMAATSILAGDLNATPWSAASARVAEAAGMTPAGPAGPTWLYRRLPEFLRFAGLPIDRIFAKGDVIVHSVRTLEPVGSDHLPLLAEFSPIPAEPDTDGSRTATAALAGAASPRLAAHPAIGTQCATSFRPRNASRTSSRASADCG